MKGEKQLRLVFWLMLVSAVTAGLTCIMKIRDGDWLAGLFGLAALASIFAVIMCRKALRKLKEEQDTEE